MGSSIAGKWEELSGKNNWKGLLDPLDIDLRRYLIQYGEFSQVCPDTFIAEIISKNAGTSRFSPENLLTKCGLDHLKYRVTKYIYATTKLTDDDFFARSVAPDAWSLVSNWIGYVAVATDEGKVELGRRDIVIAWRGTVTERENTIDLKISLVPAPIIFGDHSPLPKLHEGFYSIYTTSNGDSPYNKLSARDQVLEEVTKLIEEYKNEEISISTTGHSLGASLATLNAVDIAFNGYNKTSQGKEIPVTAFPYACPRSGNEEFKTTVDALGNLHILRITNNTDLVPQIPPNILGYRPVGEELVIYTTTSPYLKEGINNAPPHNLEIYIHGVAGSHGADGPFELDVNRSVLLVNKQTDALKTEYLIPKSWWIQKYKGIVQQKDGSWVFQDREDYPLAT